MPGILNAQISGTLLAGTLLKAHDGVAGPDDRRLAAGELAEEFSGAVQGEAKMEVRKWKLGNGGYAGHIRLVDGRLSYTPFQSLLARFLNDRGLLDLALDRARRLRVDREKRPCCREHGFARGRSLRRAGAIYGRAGPCAFRHALDRPAARVRAASWAGWATTFSTPATTGCDGRGSIFPAR